MVIGGVGMHHWLSGHHGVLSVAALSINHACDSFAADFNKATVAASGLNSLPFSMPSGTTKGSHMKNARLGDLTVARIGLGAVAATPLLASKAADALIGKKLDDASLEAAGHAASEICKPIDDMRGTIDFRVHVTGVLTRRALTIAAERAKKV